MAPLLPIALALALGIIVAGELHTALWLIAPLAVAAGAMALRRGYVALTAATVALGGVLGLSAGDATQLPPQVIAGAATTYSGVIREYREYDTGQSLIVRVDSCEGGECAPFLCVAVVPGLYPRLTERDRIIFRAELHPIENHAVLPDETDRYASLARLGVAAEVYIRPDDFGAIRPESGLLNDIRRMRYGVQRAIVESGVTVPAQNFLIAVLTGDREYLTADTRDIYVSSGIAHVLALSGLHVGIIMACLMLVLSPLRLWRLRWLVRVITLLLLWIFAVLTGLTPSVVRAVVMASVWLLACSLERRVSPLNSMAFAAIIIMVFEPTAIFTAGFQLSFAAVTGVILLSERLNPVRNLSSPWRWPAECAAVTLSAVIATGIISAYYFNVFPLYFLVANLPVALLLPPLLGGGILLTVLTAIGVKAVWLAAIVSWLHSLIHSSATALGSLPGAALRDISVEPWEVVAYFAVFALALLGVAFRKRLLLYVSVIVAVASVGAHYLFPPVFPFSELYITRSRTETTMVIREGEHLRSFTTARPALVSEIMSRDSARYHRYILRRRVKSFVPLSESDTAFPARLRDNIVAAHGHTFLFAYNDAHALPQPHHIKPDYLVVCRGFRGDVCALASSIAPDSILLGYDLNLRRHDRYLRELTAAGYPVRSLRTSHFCLTD